MKYLKLFVLICMAAILSGCDFEGMYQKIIPENVRAMDDKYIQALLDKDMEQFRSLQGELTEEEFEQAIGKMFEAVPTGEITDRSVVGVQHNSSFGTEGKSKDIQNIFEFKKGDKFLLVALVYALDEKEDCCRLAYFQATQYDESPVKAGLDQAARIGKIVGLVLLAFVLIGLFVLISYIRRKRRKREGLSR